MKISIITVCLNSDKTIEKCIKSVNAQTYNNIEHIFIDGGSIDTTLDVIKKYSDDTRRLYKQKSDGIYGAINEGLSKSTGDFLGLLHSDDEFFDENTIKNIVSQINLMKCEALYGNLCFISKNDSNKTSRYWRPGIISDTKIKFGWMLPHPTLYISKSLFLKLEGYSEQYKISGDYDFILRMIKLNHKKICYFDKELVKMFPGGASNGSLKKFLIKLFEDMQIMRANKIPLITGLWGKKILKLNQLKYWRIKNEKFF